MWEYLFVSVVFAAEGDYYAQKIASYTCKCI